MKNRAFVFGRMLLPFALALCAFASSWVFAQTPQVAGRWANGPNLPYFPVHVSLLPNSNVLIWPGDGGVSGDDPRVWNPVSGSVTTRSRAGFDLFCTGHTFLPDGRLFVAGGHIENLVGLRDAAIYDPLANTWTRQPPMNLGRWYPTTTALPNGDVLVVAGSVDVPTGGNPLPQVWQAATGTWRDLTSAQLAMPLYPFMFLAPNGLVFNAGPELTTRYLNTAGTGAWTAVANRTFDAERDYGGAVMYEPGKILTLGGADPPTNTAEVIDLNATAPAWRAVGSMSVARRHMNTTVLPDGKVLVTGGTSGPGFNNASTPVFAAELWDPATGVWTTMAAGTVPRLYHSSAVLLPDARVLISGGNGYTQSEIFSPPYLFAGARPSITSAPASASKGQSIFVGTPDAAGITGVTWVALPSVTHSNNMNQGVFRSTSITQSAGGINITAPNNPTVPPGFYMLFLLRNGVPSEARIVQLGEAAQNLTAAGTIIAKITAPLGGGSRNMEVIRDGVRPAAGSAPGWTDQYDTWDGANAAADDWIGYQYTAAQTFNRVVFQEGINFSDGGWFNTLTVQVRQGTNWVNVSGLTSTPTYPGTNNGINYETYTLQFAPISGDAIRIFGAPGGAAAFISVAELLVFGGGTAPPPAPPPPTGNPAPALASLAPASTAAGSAAFTLSVNGSSFVAGSTVRWNGADRPTTFVSATRVTAAIPAADVAAAGTAQVTVFNAAPGGGTSAAQTFTISSPQASQNLTAAGTIIAKITAPLGGGSRNIQIIRDGVTPAAGSPPGWTDQYDTWDGANAAADDWIGYQYTAAQTFNRVVFQEGINFSDGGWFNTLTVQVRQGANWVNVSGLASTPAYPGTNNGINYETYTLQFAPISGDAIRIFGAPGGAAAFISVAELLVFGSGTGTPPPPPANNPVPALASLTPASTAAGSAAFSLSVNGSNFVAGSTVRWNGADRPTTFVSATRLTAAIPAGDVATAGTAQVTVFNAAPGGGTSAAQAFTISSAQASQNLTALGTVIAKITAPLGGGSRNIQIIRDGVTPAAGSPPGWTDQYDTWDGANAAADDWIGYQFGAAQTFNRVVFQEGINFSDGGWFNNLTVQVRQGAIWVNVSGLASTPAYPGINNGINYETYNLQFAPISGDAIRIFGAPGGAAAFISVAELLVFGF